MELLNHKWWNKLPLHMWSFGIHKIIRLVPENRNTVLWPSVWFKKFRMIFLSKIWFNWKRDRYQQQIVESKYWLSHTKPQFDWSSSRSFSRTTTEHDKILNYLPIIFSIISAWVISFSIVWQTLAVGCSLSMLPLFLSFVSGRADFLRARLLPVPFATVAILTDK